MSAEKEGELPANAAIPHADELSHVTTATLTHLLSRRGFRNSFMEGIAPLDPAARIVGRARTLRFLPARGSVVSQPGGGEGNPQRLVIESIGPGDVLVIDGGGDVAGGGLVGDILSARIKYLGGVGLVADGAVRDTAQIADVGLPVWVRGVHGDGHGRGLYPADYDQPVRCGGVTVMPGDYIVADGDGVVVIPPEHVADVAAVGFETERKEAFIRRKISVDGYPSTTAYPPNEDVLREYEEYKRVQGW